MNKFKIGDKVVVKDFGRFYTTYDKWAFLHRLCNYTSSHPDKDSILTIKAIGFHGSSGGHLVLCGLSDGRRDYICDADGLSKVITHEYIWLLKIDSKYALSPYVEKESDLKDLLKFHKGKTEIVFRIDETKREKKDNN
jgi:hypothetical protein